MAGYAPACLNRQAILLMEALGTKKDVFIHALGEQVRKMENLEERVIDNDDPYELRITDVRLFFHVFCSRLPFVYKPRFLYSSHYRIFTYVD